MKGLQILMSSTKKTDVKASGIPLLIRPAFRQKRPRIIVAAREVLQQSLFHLMVMPR